MALAWGSLVRSQSGYLGGRTHVQAHWRWYIVASLLDRSLHARLTKQLLKWMPEEEEKRPPLLYPITGDTPSLLPLLSVTQASPGVLWGVTYTGHRHWQLGGMGSLRSISEAGDQRWIPQVILKYHKKCMDLQRAWGTHQYTPEGKTIWTKSEKQLKSQEYQYCCHKSVAEFQKKWKANLHD